VPYEDTSSGSDIYLAVYRARADDPENYRRVGSVRNNINQRAATVIFTDNISDADIASAELLYIAGGVLEATYPPQYRASAMAAGRHFCADRENEHVLHYSREVGDHYEPPYHNDVNRLALDPAHGRIVAIGEILEKPVVLQERRLVALEGSGLDDIGGGQQYRPFIVADGIGCDVPNSLVASPVGLIWIYGGRFWRWDGTASKPKPVGDRVSYYAQTNTFTHGVAYPDQHICIWYSSNEYDLVYDWLYDAWSADLNRTAKGACVVNGLPLWLDPSGYVWQEAPGSYDDNGSFINMKLRTSFVSPAELAGGVVLKEVSPLGYNIGAHELRVRMRINGAPYWTDDKRHTPAVVAFDSSQHYGPDDDSWREGQYLLRLQPSTRDISSFQIDVIDLPVNGNTAGYELLGFSCLIDDDIDQAVRVGRTRHMIG
jgi:hypothetical protein